MRIIEEEKMTVDEGGRDGPASPAKDRGAFIAAAPRGEDVPGG